VHSALLAFVEFGLDESRWGFRDYSFAPSALASFPFFTHSLRRGLHSFAASRLIG